MEARGGVSPAQRYADGDEDEDEDGTASTYSSVDADSDTMSVMAIEEEPSSSKSKKPKMRLRENRARAWCTKHSVNSKAMGIARATAKELSKVFSRAKSWKYQSTLDQGAPTNDQLRRLLTAGFFLNAAVNKPTVQAFRRGGPQYFALYSGVLGSLFKGSSVPLLEKQQNVLPPWILFDSILRLNTTTFLVLATPLDDAWIQAESPAFYAMCCKKRAELPVQTIEFPHLPHPVVKGLFGKSYQHLQRWESQLKCTLTLDRDTGNLTVFCAPIHEAQIKSKLSSRIDLLLRRLGGQNAEFHYMGRTRAVVGEGFQVHELLFEDEFNSIVVRNLPDTTDGEIESQLVRWASRAGCGPDMIREVDLLRHLSSGSQSASVTIKFTTKTAARLMYDFVRGDASGGDVGESVTVTPVRVTADAEAAVGAEFAGRIKLTWADGEATGEAKVFFRTAHDANTFIRGIAASEWGATRAIAIGAPVDAPKTENVQPAIGRGGLNRGQRTPPKPGAQPPPPAARPPTRREPSGASDSFHVVFDVEAIDKLPLEDQVQFRYGVHLKPGLPRTMDEVELLTKVRRLGVSPVYAKVTRKPVAATTANDSVMARELEVRYSRMLPLLTCLDDTAVHTDFVDQGTRRVGVVVFCRDLQRLKETFEMAEASLLWSELEKPHGQPIRMEIEYSFTTTLHKDLRRCFREQLAQVFNFARAKGVETQEMQPKAVFTTAAKNMVTFKFLGEMAVLQRIKEKLDTATHCEKVTLDNLHLVFSFTGRIKISRLMDKHIDEKNSTLRYFIRWINKRKEVWVYGDKPSREHAIGIVSTLIDELKTQSVLDKMVRLNLNKSLAPGAVNTWLATAPSVRALYFHSVISSKRVIVTGSETKVEEFLQALTADNMLFQPRKRQCPEATTQVCPLCTCTVDDPSVVLTSCNDSYCVGCIEGMFKVSTLTLPALCWSGECRRRMHIDDLSKILPDAEAVASVVEMAVFDYVAKHKSEVLICPNAGCNQILSVAKIKGGDPAAFGGRSIFCDVCQTSYCMDCTALADRPIPRHAKYTCEQFRARQTPPHITRHLRFIQDHILNLSCPHCHCVFLDFSGCTSVQCGNATCGHFFCANCLDYSSASSSDTHNHVRTCPQNPNDSSCGSKGYFVSDEALARVRHTLRQHKIQEYFRTKILNEVERGVTYKRIASDLQHFGLDLPASLRGSSDGVIFEGGEEQESPEDAAVRRHVQCIREQHLNLRCPKCALVFVDFDFDSCAALTCANPQCGCGFCAYCLADCGSDAHAHVAKCDKNANKPYFYVTKEQFLEVHKQRRETLIYQYLRGEVQPTAGLHVAQRVASMLEADLRAIGITIKLE